MSSLSAIEVISDEWSRKARCPVCKGGFLQIQKSDLTSEQMHCPHCQVSYFIEKAGEHIFFTNFPLSFPEGLKNRWVSRHEISSELAKNPPQKKKASLNIPTANPLRAEAVRRARTLVELGNNKNDIRKALAASMQLTEFAINEIITDAFRVHQMKQKQKTKKFILYASVIGIGLILVLILLLILF